MSKERTRRLSRRIILLAALLVFGTVLAIVNGVVVAGARRRANAIAAQAPEPVQRALERCARDPASWRSVHTRRLHVDAFDETTLSPMDKSGEPLDTSLFARMQQGEKAPVAVGLLWGQGTRVVWRDSSHHPCGILQGEIGISRATIRNVELTFLVAVLFAGLAIAVTYALVVRPLHTRIRRLRVTAEKLGDTVGHHATDHEIGDLDTIAGALEVGIMKHEEARVQLALRADRLEHHLAEVAHDLRTPLTALQLALERLVGSMSAEDRQKIISRALAEHMYVTTLLDNLETATTVATDLPTARVESDVELGMLLEGIVARFSLLAEQRGVELALSRPDESVIVRSPPLLLERGVSNIVHNAIRHGRFGGHVAVLLVCEGKRFVLSIEDDGAGMSDELLASLGQSQEAALRGVPRANGSRGLGLAVANVAFARARLDVAYRRAPQGGLLVEMRGEYDGC